MVKNLPNYNSILQTPNYYWINTVIWKVKDKKKKIFFLLFSDVPVYRWWHSVYTCITIWLRTLASFLQLA